MKTLKCVLDAAEDLNLRNNSFRFDWMAICTSAIKKGYDSITLAGLKGDPEWRNLNWDLLMVFHKIIVA